MSKHLPNPTETVRSQKLLERLIAANPEFLQSNDKSTILWKSPIFPDYAEYQDQDFLDQLETGPLDLPLREFWPTKGPVWDGLGIANNKARTRILVEAKAYIEEADTKPTQSKGASRDLIESSLIETRKFMKATGGHADWSRSFYQYGNRLAHLYFLSQRNSISSELWFIYFCDLPGDSAATSFEEWKGALRLLHKHLGIGRSHPFRDQLREFFVDASTLSLCETNRK